jgi:tricorn protease
MKLPLSPSLHGICLAAALALVTSTPVARGATDSDNLWLRYPAISPDGSNIAFSHRGDIMVAPALGGTAVLLTRHPAHDTMPVWSHDGKTIAFASDRYGNFDVFTIPATGGGVTRLTANSAPDYPSDFSPDDQHVLFSSERMDSRESILFPYRRMAELYSAPASGGRTEMVLTTPAHDARYSPDGRWIAFHDYKGYEDEWRKHHVSSVTRDVWLYDTQTRKYAAVSTFAGEDRSPVWSEDGRSLFYLSEQSGSFNVWAEPLPEVGGPESPRRQVTNFEGAPVRFLTSSQVGDLCFNYRGGVWILPAGASQPRRVAITVGIDEPTNPTRWTTLNKDVTEFTVSPDGNQIACIARGEVFVLSADGRMLKRVTNTAEQERNVSFSADGKKLLYCSQRDGTWNLYESRFNREEELYYFNATIIEEETLLADGVDNQKPSYSPDGKQVAYLAARDFVKVLTLADSSVRTVITDEHNYSYQDLEPASLEGALWFEWSPDGQWLLASLTDRNRWSYEIGLFRVADEPEAPRNLTQSGYEDLYGHWALAGAAVVWRTDRQGLRPHGSVYGGQEDIYLKFFTQAAYDRSRSFYLER